jgi:serine/threonine protein kinase
MWNFSFIRTTDNIYCYLCNKTLIELIEEIKSDSSLKKDKTLTTIGYYITSQLFIEILESVQYLHQNNIIHS